MPISYRIDPETSIAVVTIQGVVSAQEQREHVERLFADPDLRPPFRILSDRREQENVPSTALVQQMARLLAGVERAAGSRLAFVVARPVQIGMSRVFAAHVSNMEIEVFTDIDRARAWLLEG
ncbi:MAG: hypothetical protein GTO22_05520 [Gemmatimonadales bacterium]|nr:hypothetical protein [Gemmatimonadales bacterium]